MPAWPNGKAPVYEAGFYVGSNPTAGVLREVRIF